MTARALEAIGEIGGPRCCKRDTFTAVGEAVRMTAEELGVEMELPGEDSLHLLRGEPAVPEGEMPLLSGKVNGMANNFRNGLDK